MPCAWPAVNIGVSLFSEAGMPELVKRLHPTTPSSKTKNVMANAMRIHSEPNIYISCEPAADFAASFGVFTAYYFS